MSKSPIPSSKQLFKLVSQQLPILQAFRFADTDCEHINRLLYWADFPSNSNVVDLGSGSGFVAAHMCEIRPDLSFCLVDNSQVQLDLADLRFRKHCSDICSVPELDNSFNALICSYAIGYVDTDCFFREVARLVQPGGIIFIVDMIPVSHDLEHQFLFGYTVRSRSVLENSAKAVGLTMDFYMEPIDNSGWGETQFSGYFNMFFGDVSPAIWRFRVP
jgi:ubiquinone/menaquinone biosynthesis C-methylase UbiE